MKLNFNFIAHVSDVRVHEKYGIALERQCPASMIKLINALSIEHYALTVIEYVVKSGNFNSNLIHMFPNANAFSHLSMIFLFWIE